MYPFSAINFYLSLGLLTSVLYCLDFLDSAFTCEDIPHYYIAAISRPFGHD